VRVISKADFLDLYENDKLILGSLVVTPIAVVCKTKPEKDYNQEVIVVNIP